MRVNEMVNGVRLRNVSAEYAEFIYKGKGKKVEKIN